MKREKGKQTESWKYEVWVENLIGQVAPDEDGND